MGMRETLEVDTADLLFLEYSRARRAWLSSSFLVGAERSASRSPGADHYCVGAAGAVAAGAAGLPWRAARR
jgi:hypothetical protein